MHAVNDVNPYIILIQIGVIVGMVNLLVQIPAFKRIGVPAVSMGLTLAICSILPKMLPDVYHAFVPEIPVWPFVVSVLLVPTLGAYAGDEIEFSHMKQMGKSGFMFVATSMIAPILLALPVGLLLVFWKDNPFIQEHANAGGVIMGIVAVIFMRALPTMIAFFKANHWDNDLVKASLLGASFDDVVVFVVIQPIIAGLMSGAGLAGILNSAIAVMITGVSMYVLSQILRKLPSSVQLPLGIIVLLAGAGLAEINGHVHVILSGIFWGMMMPKSVTKAFEHKTKDFIIMVLVPLFFAGLGITHQFEILAWQPLVLMGLCWAAAYSAHEFITAPVAAKLFQNNKVAGKVLGSLCRTHGTADVLLAASLFDMGIFTTFGLSGIMLYLMGATIQAFGQAQGLVDAHPELASARIQILPLPDEEILIGTFQEGLVFASQDEAED